MQKKLFYTLGIVFSLVSCSVMAQVNVTSNVSAQQMAAKLAGPGVTILNPVLTCPDRASGVFRVTASNLGIDSGIVLTSGLATPFGSGFGVSGAAYNLASNRSNAPGATDLEPLAGQNTHDACALEFDVIPQGDTVKFDYVFGSEEYINATCGPYNDAFAFFISGPGIPATDNMALVPGTNIPVTINSINNGIPGPNYNIATCNSMGPGSPFTSYYVDNSSGTTLTYQGITKVLRAFHAVTPCNTYHLRMVIADGGNFIYDSGVFIRAGSLQANTFTIQPVGGDSVAVPDAAVIKDCRPGRFRISRPQARPVAETVKFIITGTAVNGVDYAAIADSVVIGAGLQEADVEIRGLATPPSGTKTVRLLVKSPLNCVGSAIADSATLQIRDVIAASILTPDTVICKSESFRLRAMGDTVLTYRWSPLTGLDSGAIKNPLVNPTVTTTYTLATSWPRYGCTPIYDSVRVTVLPIPELTVQVGLRVCLHQSLQLGVAVSPTYSGYNYTWYGAGGFMATGATPVLTNALRADSGYYTVIVGLDTSRCTARDSFLVRVEAPDSPGVAPIIFCQGIPAAPLTAIGGDLRWYSAPQGGQGSTVPPVPNTNMVGVTPYYVSQTAFGCESERNVVPVEVKVCCDKPIFIPTAFTPNNDGRNDFFAPRYSGYGFSTGRLRIFNRWGQMVYEGFNNTMLWNGTWNGRECPGDTYYYEVLIHCKEGGDQHLSGDILLVR